jgi:hypothetical protein
MKRTLTIALLALSSVPLSACAGGYGMQVGYAEPYAYDGWYDGSYGPIYDGYWGNDGYFYYRHAEGEGAYVRGDRNHFAHQAAQLSADPRHHHPAPGRNRAALSGRRPWWRRSRRRWPWRRTGWPRRPPLINPDRREGALPSFAPVYSATA